MVRTFVTLFLAGGALVAQQAQRPAFVSPEVMPDGRVTMRLWAPGATDVLLSGDWMGPQPAPPLTRDASGVWTITGLPVQLHVGHAADDCRDARVGRAAEWPAR